MKNKLFQTAPAFLTLMAVTTFTSCKEDDGYQKGALIENINGVTYGGGKFITFGDRGKMAYAPSGTSWTTATNIVFGSSVVHDYGGDRFVVAGYEGKIAYSNVQE